MLSIDQRKSTKPSALIAAHDIWVKIGSLLLHRSRLEALWGLLDKLSPGCHVSPFKSANQQTVNVAHWW